VAEDGSAIGISIAASSIATVDMLVAAVITIVAGTRARFRVSAAAKAAITAVVAIRAIRAIRVTRAARAARAARARAEI
jgi:hypothetical protein